MGFNWHKGVRIMEVLLYCTKLQHIDCTSLLVLFICKAVKWKIANTEAQCSLQISGSDTHDVSCDFHHN